MNTRSAVGELIDTPNGRFYAERSGPGSERTIVFVSAFGDDHTSWARVVEGLSSSYGCITFDNRGIGQSPSTPGPYSIPQMADDVHELVRALDAGPVIAVGSSMGGAICQEWAMAHPDAVTDLVLTNTWAERDVWLSHVMNFWIELAEQGRGRELLHQWVLFCFSPDFIAAHPGVVDEVMALPVPDLRGLAAAGRALLDHHTIDRLANIKARTLVIGAEQDVVTRPALSTQLAEAIPAARLDWMPTGHMSFWEQPEAWTRLVRDFLRSEP